jgi:hypothetical protein
MKDEFKKKSQLINELSELRKLIKDLLKSGNFNLNSKKTNMFTIMLNISFGKKRIAGFGVLIIKRNLFLLVQK